MRPIKFRAWDTIKNKMWSAEEMGMEQLTLSVDGRGFINVHGKDTSLSRFYDFLIPEQFTGLLDKNGKEIYEDDILAFPNHAIVWVVKWNEVGFSFKIWSERLGWAKLRAYDYPEIVGNIHENPELLKGGE